MSNDQIDFNNFDIKKFRNSPGGLEVVAEHYHSREGGNLSQCGNDAKEIFKK
jgi:hypothetical protein